MKNYYANGMVVYTTKEKKKNFEKKAQKIIREELKITIEEARELARAKVNILKLIHPKNVGKGFKNGIEIKFLLRGEGQTISLPNLTLYRLDDENEIEKYAQKIHEYSQFAHCEYYSLYTYDNTVEVDVATNKIGPDGKNVIVKAPAHQIQRGNAVETHVLPFDMDNVSKEEYEAFQAFLNGLGINILAEKTGGGYQGLILLKKAVKQKTLFKKFTDLLLKLGWNIDASIIDPERVFRSFYSHNAKEFSSSFKNYKPNGAKLVSTEIVSYTEDRYELKYVLKLLESCLKREKTKDVVTVPKKKKEKIETVMDILEVTEKPTNKVKNGLAAEYEFINFDTQPQHVKNILSGAPEGYRNASVLYLTNYLNNHLGLSPEQALETLKTFNKQCSPSMPETKLKSDYYRISDKYGHYKNGLYTTEMAKVFGQIDNDTIIRANFDKIKVERNMILKVGEIGSTAFKMYMTMLYIEIKSKKEVISRKELADMMGVSEKTVSRAFEKLSAVKKVLSVTVNRKIHYKINPWARYDGGFVLFNKLLVKDMINELSEEQTAIYSVMYFLAKMFESTMLLTSQEHLASILNLNQPRISQLTDELEKKEYIYKKTFITKNHKKKSEYVLRNE